MLGKCDFIIKCFDQVVGKQNEHKPHRVWFVIMFMNGIFKQTFVGPEFKRLGIYLWLT